MPEKQRDSLKAWVLPAAFAALAASGTVFSALAPSLAGKLALRSSVELTAERPYELISHLLPGSGVAGTVRHALYCFLSSRLLAPVVSPWRQATLMVGGAAIGATVFVLLGTLEFFWGPGLMVWSLAGAVAVYGCWKWREQPRLWRVFIVVTVVAIAVSVVDGTAVGRAQFASSALGALMCWGGRKWM